MDFNLKLIVEGYTKLYVPQNLRDTSYVFYNPENKPLRDVSCIFIKSLEKDLTYLDLLAGTGASGLRIANESNISSIVLNDKNPYAYKLIKRNAELNNLSVKIYNKEANLLMRENVYKFDVIDIDPFGSPVHYLDNAIATVRKNGYLIVSATDLAPLNGVNIKACYRKYQSIPIRIPTAKEIGLRILIGYIIRTAAKYSRAIKVLLSLYYKHMYKVYLFVEHGKKRADASLENLGYLYYCKRCLRFEISHEIMPKVRICSNCNKPFEIAGPLYIGKLKDESLIKRMNRYAEKYFTDKRFKKFYERFCDEYDTFLYYDLHHVASVFKLKVKSIDLVINELKNLGYNATRTIFSNYGIKTDADLSEIIKILKND